MAGNKTKARTKTERVIDLTWMPTQDQCHSCEKTLELGQVFDGFFGGVRADGTRPDDYEEWHVPMAGIVRLCRTCADALPPEGFKVTEASTGRVHKLILGRPLPVRL